MGNVNNKTLLVILSLVLVLLIIFNVIFKSERNKDNINYGKVTAEDLIYDGTEVKDRQLYFTLESIISKYISSYKTAYDSDGNLIDLESDSKYSYEDYYGALTDEYKSYLGRSKYIEVAKKFMTNFFVKSGSEEVEVHYFMDTYQLIKGVYEIDENMYICKLYSSYNDKTSYIGIALDTGNMEFRIFFLE